jgi:hydrogenase maturation protease
MHPLKVLQLVRALGGHPRRMLVVGCEPAPPAVKDGDWHEGLSAPVAAAVDEAVVLVESLVEELLSGRALAGKGAR